MCHLFGCWVSHRQESTELPSIYRGHARHDGRCSSPLCPGLRNQYMRAPAPRLLYYCDRYELAVLKEVDFALSGNLKKNAMSLSQTVLSQGQILIDVYNTVICHVNTILCAMIYHVVKYYTFSKLRRRILKDTDQWNVSQSSPSCISDENTVKMIINMQHCYKRYNTNKESRSTQKLQSQRDSAYHKSCLKWPGIEPWPSWWKVDN